MAQRGMLSWLWKKRPLCAVVGQRGRGKMTLAMPERSLAGLAGSAVDELILSVDRRTDSLLPQESHEPLMPMTCSRGYRDWSWVTASWSDAQRSAPSVRPGMILLNTPLSKSLLQTLWQRTAGILQSDLDMSYWRHCQRYLPIPMHFFLDFWPLLLARLFCVLPVPHHKWAENTDKMHLRSHPMSCILFKTSGVLPMFDW